MSLAWLMALWRLAPAISVCVSRPGVKVAAMWELSSRDCLGSFRELMEMCPCPLRPHLPTQTRNQFGRPFFCRGLTTWARDSHLRNLLSDPGASGKRTQAYQLLSGTPAEQRPLNNPDACESWEEAAALIWSTFFTMPAEGNHCL